MDSIMERLESIFRDVFDDVALKINRATTAKDIPGWDSVSNINLIFAIEQEFKIKIALGELQDLNNVGEMAELIQRKTRSR